MVNTECNEDSDITTPTNSEIKKSSQGYEVLWEFTNPLYDPHFVTKNDIIRQCIGDMLIMPFIKIYDMFRYCNMCLGQK